MKIFEGLGMALQAMRLKAGYSQRALAAKCRASEGGSQVTQAMLSQWERGAQVPALKGLDTVLETLGFDLIDLQEVLEKGGARVVVPRAKRRRRQVERARLETLTQELQNLRTRLEALERERNGEWEWGEENR